MSVSLNAFPAAKLVFFFFSGQGGPILFLSLRKTRATCRVDTVEDPELVGGFPLSGKRLFTLPQALSSENVR